MRNDDNLSREADLNMQHVNINDFCEYIRDRIEMEDYEMPILGLGKSGIGKTECIENNVCKPLGIGLIEMRLSSYEETDLTGFPIPQTDPATGETLMRFADVSKFPHVGRDPEVGILLLDEFTAARQAVRGAALQLTDKSRSIGDYHLPPKWLVVILGNGPTDGGYFQGLEYALMARADCFRIDVSFEAWKKWAIKNAVHPAVIGFIEQADCGPLGMLHRIKSMDDVEYEEKEANPRCWAKLSSHLKKKEERIGGMLDPRQCTIYAGAAVGADLAVKFAAYYAYQDEMIKVPDILNGSALNLNFKHYRIESLYMSTMSLVGAVIEMLNSDAAIFDKTGDISPESVKKFQNAMKYILKLADSGRVDIAFGILNSIGEGVPFLLEYMMSSTFDEHYPEWEAVSEKCGGIQRFDNAM